MTARSGEIKEVHKHEVYHKVPTKQGWDRTGKSPIKTRWIDINKGDKIHPELRSRLASKDYNTGKRPDLFAATPPLEALKLLISIWMTEVMGYGNFEPYVMDFIHIHRAYFHAYATREVYVDLPTEDHEEGMCGKLYKSMYGTRDAAQNWEAAYTEFMKE